MIAWRVQNAAGRGPYSVLRGNVTWQTGCPHSGCDCHPNPTKELGVDWYILTYGTPKGRLLCGFLSKKQALAWFAPMELERLARFGFVLQKVHVTGILAGNRRSKQVVFYRRGS